ncbi:DUF4345 family protein [Oleiharenicola lentus]|uniref:DUF4345 family protein n=1 Tax=Oleiharenicola lentus TaxID=2508720 RepID=UPI003F6660B8
MKLYLWINAALYFVFAVWCTLKPKETSFNIGYVDLNNSGRSEYLVIYGGLQLGLALMFAWLGSQQNQHATGITLSLLFYAPLVIFRAVTLLQQWPVGGVTLATAGLELLLFVGALVLWLRLR